MFISKLMIAVLPVAMIYIEEKWQCILLQVS